MLYFCLQSTGNKSEYFGFKIFHFRGEQNKSLEQDILGLCVSVFILDNFLFIEDLYP